jgi:hypothetical protein
LNELLGANPGAIPSLQEVISHYLTQMTLGAQMPDQVNSQELQSAILEVVDWLDVDS